jgi:hypothetical protein
MKASIELRGKSSDNIVSGNIIGRGSLEADEKNALIRDNLEV